MRCQWNFRKLVIEFWTCSYISYHMTRRTCWVENCAKLNACMQGLKFEKYEAVQSTVYSMHVALVLRTLSYCTVSPLYLKNYNRQASPVNGRYNCFLRTAKVNFGIYTEECTRMCSYVCTVPFWNICIHRVYVVLHG